MTEPQLIIDSAAPRAWIDRVESGVDYYNVAVTGLCDYYPVSFLIKGTAGQIDGGIVGNIWGGWLHVRRLWVASDCRHRGYGKWLMALAEEYASERKCVGSFLSTQSYQARPLYESLGYSIYGELNDHPVAGHSKYLMFKTLGAGADAAACDGAELIADSYPSRDALDAIESGLTIHSAAALGMEVPAQPLRAFLRTSQGEVVGGALGNTRGLWLFISHLWIDSPLRRSGFGSRLVTAIEDAAIGRGCTGAFLETFSFQARPLYEKLGYTLFAELSGHPQGHSHYFMAKRLGR